MLAAVGALLAPGVVAFVQISLHHVGPFPWYDEPGALVHIPEVEEFHAMYAGDGVQAQISGHTGKVAGFAASEGDRLAYLHVHYYAGLPATFSHMCYGPYLDVPWPEREIIFQEGRVARHCFGW